MTWHVKEVQRLRQTVSVAARGRALCAAARYGQTAAARLLLELPAAHGVAGADATRALRVAAAIGRAEVIRVLVSLPAERGIDPSVDDHCALRWAAASGQAERHGREFYEQTDSEL